MERSLLHNVYNFGDQTPLIHVICANRSSEGCVGVGNFRLHPRFHPTSLGWNLGPTREFPTLGYASPTWPWILKCGLVSAEKIQLSYLPACSTTMPEISPGWWSFCHDGPTFPEAVLTFITNREFWWTYVQDLGEAYFRNKNLQGLGLSLISAD